MTGRLRDLENKELYADDYGIKVDAQPRKGPLGTLIGVRSIEVRLDGVREYYDTQTCVGCSMVAYWTFAGRERDGGEHTIDVIVTDDLGARATDSWTVIRSLWSPLPYEWEFIRDAREFRTHFALRADDAWLDYTIHDPALDGSRSRYNFPLTADEEEQIEDGSPSRQAHAAADLTRGHDMGFNRPAAVAYAEEWAYKRRGGQFGGFENDCT
ncbi:MAG: hypothetical protein M3320_08070, partial [Actinomycetota bacterium]|nr:hypothetical protein [Actinomycetota bacterium]